MSNTSSVNISSDDSSLSGVPADLVPNLTRECLEKVREQPTCHVRRTEDNGSRLICEPRHVADSENTGAIHAVFLSVVVVTVVLTVVLNLVVMLTIAVNKKLHTLINYLVSLLCANQLIWVIFPIIEADIYSYKIPIFCKIRYYTLKMTPTANFGLIVTITLLRYLMVVRNHRYPAVKRNIFMFTLLAGIPTFMRTVMFGQEDNGLCGSVFAWTPDDYEISKFPPRNRNTATLIYMVIEYIIGLTIILFCYYKIQHTALASKKRLMQQPSGPTQQGRNVTSSEPGSANRDSRTSDTRRPETEPTRQADNQSSTGRNSAQHQPSTRKSSITNQPSSSRQSLSDGLSTNQETVAITAMISPQSTNIATVPIVERIARPTKRHLTVPSAIMGHSRRRNGSPHPVVAWTASPESNPGAQATDRRPEPAGEVILSAATLQSSASPAPSPSSSTSECGVGRAGTLHGPQNAGSGFPQSGAGPAPSLTVRSGRAVDVVATMAMIAFLVTFILSFTPYVAVVHYARGAEKMCVFMPGKRLSVFIFLVISGGITGILNPLICVVFSSEFREALRKTFAMFVRRLSGMTTSLMQGVP